MLNVAIIGTGNISGEHIRSYLAFPDRCRIVALVDIYPQKAEEKKRLYDLHDAEVYDSHEAILGRKDIHIVDVCTPPYVHASISIDALNAGKHVLCEKPMAASLQECDAMLKAAEVSGKTLSIIAQNRFTDAFMRLKAVLDSGLAGKICHAQVDSAWWRGHSYYDLWWRGCWDKEGGGCTLNHAVHHIDALLWMMGKPQQVMAVMSNTAHDNAEVEDLSVAVLKFANGALAQITASVVHHGEQQQMIFQGEAARVSAPWQVHASLSAENGFPQPDKNQPLEEQIMALYDGHKPLEHVLHTGHINDFLSAIEHNRQPLVDGQQGKQSLAMITAIYKAAITQSMVDFPLAADDPFYKTGGIAQQAPHFFEKSASVENFSNDTLTLGRDL